MVNSTAAADEGNACFFGHGTIVEADVQSREMMKNHEKVEPRRYSG